MDLDDIARERLEDGVIRQCRRVVVTALTRVFATRVFAYTVASEFGCIITGEAFMFLRIPQKDYSQLFYVSSCPRR